jgi:hypothetical protein
MRKYLFLFLFIGFIFPLQGKTPVLPAENFPELQRQEMEIKLLFDTLNNAGDILDSAEYLAIDKTGIGGSIRQKLGEMLRDKNSFFYPFDSLQYLGKIYSDDNKVRIYSWNCELTGFRQQFYGFVQTEKTCVPLRSSQTYIPDPQKDIPLNNWYGALYYKAVRIEKGNQAKYILLGWSRLNERHSFKVIDVLAFDDKKASLGAPIFELDNGKNARMVFDYCSNVRMTINYDEKKKKIVFDHLSPTGMELDEDRCNAPDMSYDALVRKGKRWVLKKDVDARNRK